MFEWSAEPNYVPVAVEAGLISLLEDVLDQDDASISSLSAAMMCLRAVTDTSFGARAVMAQPDLCKSIVAASARILEKGCADQDVVIEDKLASPTIDAAGAADTLHVLANLLASGTMYILLLIL
jgi:hypothetical protein